MGWTKAVSAPLVGDREVATRSKRLPSETRAGNVKLSLLRAAPVKNNIIGISRYVFPALNPLSH